MSTVEEDLSAINPITVAATTSTTASAYATQGGTSENDSTTRGTNTTTAAAAVTTTPISVIPKSKQQESDELTKRLQKLALERQKESKGERLKVIQNPQNSHTMIHLTSAKTFQELNLPAYLLDAIFAMGFDRPSAIQEEALPRILADPPRNLIGQAQSGSGKVRKLNPLLLPKKNVKE